MTQEQQLHAAQESAAGVPKKKAMTARTKSNLSFVKQHKPELFNRRLGAGEEDPSAPPPGFKPREDGWMHNPDTNVFLDPAGRKLWFDTEADDYRELFEGSATPFAAAGGAACSGGSSGSAPAKHLFIPDLHRTSQALKADLGHLDRPAALLVVFDPSATPPHEKLIRKLASSRSEWSEEELASAVVAVMGAVSAEASGAIALALVVGQTALVAQSGGARCWLFGEALPSSQAPARGVDRVAVRCHDASTKAGAHAILAVGALGLSDTEVQETAAPHLCQSRPRAGCIALLRKARHKGTAAMLGVGCMRLSAAGYAAMNTAPSPGQPAAKRQRVVGVDAREVPGRVRVRQILLRTWRGGTAPKPEDPVRRKPVQRTQEEAEGQLMKVLDSLREVKDGLAKSFTSACRSTSECPSSLQGGELAGDVGWLDKDKGLDSQRANGKMVRPAVPAPVLRAAFELEVGEMSDLVSSEVGVHLLLRSA